jgi:hypothetical protein
MVAANSELLDLFDHLVAGPATCSGAMSPKTETHCRKGCSVLEICFAE